jgi:hypothetical protein
MRGKNLVVSFVIERGNSIWVFTVIANEGILLENLPRLDIMITEEVAPALGCVGLVYGSSVFLLCRRCLLLVLSLGTVAVWGVGATVLHVVWAVPELASTGILLEPKSEVLINFEIVKDLVVCRVPVLCWHVGGWLP